jgi:hemerythrin superfamily protein
MNGVEMLKQQHREVERLFEQFDAARSREQRHEVFRKIAEALAVHAVVEEQDFYPAVNQRGTSERVLESVEAHLEIQRLLARMLLLASDDERFDPSMKVLRENVAHHVAEEEHDLFPQVERLFDEKALARIADAIARTQSDLAGAEGRASG